MENDKITSLNKYLELISRIEQKTLVTSRGDQLIFRGTPNSKWPLTPGYNRIYIPPDSQFKESREYGRWEDFVFLHQNGRFDEFNVLSEFRKIASALLSQDVLNNWLLLLQYAQHFGVPTRLLDFTTNPLIALYFAAKENPDDDAKITVIHDRLYNEWLETPKAVDIKLAMGDTNCEFRSYSQVDHIKNIERIATSMQYNEKIQKNVLLPEIFTPLLLDPRMEAQDSIFLMWGQLPYSLDYIFKNVSDSDLVMMERFSDGRAELFNGSAKGFLTEVIIERDAKDAILKELDICGINEKRIFPGLDGIGKYIRNKYTANPEDRKEAEKMYRRKQYE